MIQRLKGAYIINCHDVVKDDSGEITEILCTYYPDSKSGSDSSGVKAKGTLHWVDQHSAVDVELRLYDRLFSVADPDQQEGRDFLEFYNEESLTTIPKAKAESFLGNARSGDQFQFMRKGYFVVDEDATPENIILNRTVSLKDSWKKIKSKQ